MAKEATLEVVSTKEATEKRKAQLADMSKQLEAKIEKTSKDLETKLYIIQGGKTAGENLLAFIKNDAQWKFSEALGIGECVRQYESAVKNIESGKTKELMIPALALEATYYFLTKVEGKGLVSADTYVNNLLKPITDALGRSKADREALDQLVRDKGTIDSAIDSGANIENEDKLIKEIESELKK
jgi:hypothetical protein